MQSGFFVIKTTLPDPWEYAAEAVCRLYTCGKVLQ